MYRIIFDTNVLISALRSQLGASYALIERIGMGEFEFCISVPLMMEYEAVAKRMHRSLGLTLTEIDDILDYLCLEGRTQQIYYLWRPVLTDPGDDMLLELAVASSASIIVTHNTAHFEGTRSFGIRAMKPKDFLKLLKEIL
jgi:putative PIN family toxin of toxin-antitoxin system